MIVPPYYRYRRNPPVQYDVERYNSRTGFWIVHRSFKVEWPMIKGWFKMKPDYSNLAGVKKARAEAYDVASKFKCLRITEVKDTGHRYVIWNRGWIEL